MIENDACTSPSNLFLRLNSKKLQKLMLIGLVFALRIA